MITCPRCKTQMVLEGTLGGFPGSLSQQQSCRCPHCGKLASVEFTDPDSPFDDADTYDGFGRDEGYRQESKS